jgi:hypothetical protein
MTAFEKRVLGLVGQARLAIPEYGTRALSEKEINRIAGVFNLAVHITDAEVPAILFPPIDGKYRLSLDGLMPRAVRRYAVLHELGHILSGEAEEPMRLIFFGALPESEDVCDLFALLGIVPPEDIDEGEEWLEGKIRDLVPLDDRGWQVHRIPRLSKRLPRIRELVAEDGGFF